MTKNLANERSIGISVVALRSLFAAVALVLLGTLWHG